MYSDAFCKVYNLFGWNYFPEAFGEELVAWIAQNHISVKSSLDLACGTGILCEILHQNGIAAHGADLSEGMIAIAKKSNPAIAYEVANMITYRPDAQFDLITCTGDALNHILDLADVARIFENVYAMLNPGGYFVFDILNENEVTPGDPIDLDFSETTQAQFHITKDAQNIIRLKTTVYEQGVFQFEEVITEIVHNPQAICQMLTRAGFRVQRCADHLLDHSNRHGRTWYIIAQK